MQFRINKTKKNPRKLNKARPQGVYKALLFSWIFFLHFIQQLAGLDGNFIKSKIVRVNLKLWHVSSSLKLNERATGTDVTKARICWD